MSFVTSAWKIMSKTAAVAPRNIMPLENASRSPRNANCLGANRSRARIALKRGKSA